MFTAAWPEQIANAKRGRDPVDRRRIKFIYVHPKTSIHDVGENVFSNRIILAKTEIGITYLPDVPRTLECRDSPVTWLVPLRRRCSLSWIGHRQSKGRTSLRSCGISVVSTIFPQYRGSPFWEYPEIMVVKTHRRDGMSITRDIHDPRPLVCRKDCTGKVLDQQKMPNMVGSKLQLNPLRGLHVLLGQP